MRTSNRVGDVTNHLLLAAQRITPCHPVAPMANEPKTEFVRGIVPSSAESESRLRSPTVEYRLRMSTPMDSRNAAHSQAVHQLRPRGKSHGSPCRQISQAARLANLVA